MPQLLKKNFENPPPPCYTQLLGARAWLRGLSPCRDLHTATAAVVEAQAAAVEETGGRHASCDGRRDGWGLVTP